MIGAYIFLIIVPISFILLWIRHFHLVYKLNIFLMRHHRASWDAFKGRNPNWFGMEPWPSALVFTFYSRAAYNFIWRSEESYGDQSIILQKRRIRRFVWELPMYFVAVMAAAALLISVGVLR